MLRKKKEITARVRQTDNLIETYETSVNWIQTHKKLLSNLGVGVVVVVLALTFYINNSRSNNEIAANEFAKIYTYYDNGQYQIAINGVPEKNIKGLQSIVADYSSTEYGNIAKVYLANAYFNQGEFDKALPLYDGASVDASILQISAIAGVAACYEAKGDFTDAAKYFEKAGKKKHDDPNAADNLASAARNYAKAGNKDQAIQLYKFLKKEYAKSPVSRDAERYIEELRG